MSTRPTVTVLMPLLKSQPFVSEAIESVLVQTFTDFEFLVLAPDRAVVNAVVADITDSRLRLLFRDMLGAADALNVGLCAAQGEFVARMDPDDLCLPERLERQVEFLSADPTLVVVGSSWEWVDESGTITSAEPFLPRTDADIRWHALFAPPFTPTSVMFRRAVAQRGGVRWDEGTAALAIDFRFHSDLLHHGRAATIPCPLVRVRYRSGELLDSLEDGVAHARVARRNVAKLGLDLHRRDFAKIRRLVLNMRTPSDPCDLTAGVALLQLLSAFRRSSGADALEAQRIAHRLIDSIVWRALRSHAATSQKTALVEAALAEHPRWIVGTPPRWLAQRKGIVVRKARRAGKATGRYVRTLPLRRPRLLLNPGSYILLLSHMRSYSTLLAHLLAGSREIGGHSELGLSYRRPIELARARATVERNDAAKPFVLDKVLHDEFAVRPCVLASERVYAIFLLRRPEPTIRSILTIRNPVGPRPTWFRDPNVVASYYERRLASLTQLAVANGDRSRTMFVRAEQFIEQPESILEAMTRHLALNEPLSTTYPVFADTGMWGAGDTSERIRRGRIEQVPSAVADALPLPESLLVRAWKAYDTASSVFADCCEELR